MMLYNQSSITPDRVDFKQALAILKVKRYFNATQAPDSEHFKQYIETDDGRVKVAPCDFTNYIDSALKLVYEDIGPCKRKSK